ncbi:MAG: acetolactate synthase small subunit [Muribaculaceae bacterium]|nr:acetolactate synthase small subunit [Muribaculaceae bacterium]
MDKQLFTVTVYSENQVGLLNQISIILTRRCLNIESVSGSASSIPGIHKFTVTCYSDRPTMEKVIKQIEKRIDVLRAFLYTDDDIVYQEIALYKVPTARLVDGGKLEKIIRHYDARILEITREYTVIEKTGHSDETEALFEVLKRYDIRQFMRSGRVAVTRDATEQVSLFLDEQERRRPTGC